MSFGKAQCTLLSDGLSQSLAGPQSQPHSCPPPSMIKLKGGPGVVASSAQAAGTPCQQLLECPPGSQGNFFPASMETRLKTGASRPSSGPCRGFQELQGKQATSGCTRAAQIFPDGCVATLKGAFLELVVGAFGGARDLRDAGQALCTAWQRFSVWSAPRLVPPPQRFQILTMYFKTLNSRL